MPKETTHELSRLRTLELKREKKKKSKNDAEGKVHPVVKNGENEERLYQSQMLRMGLDLATWKVKNGVFPMKKGKWRQVNIPVRAFGMIYIVYTENF